MSDDKNFEQEYQYVDDSAVNDPQEPKEEVFEQTQSKAKSNSDYISKLNTIIKQPNIRRNGLIAVAGLFVIIFLIKSIGSDDITKKSANTAKAIAPEKIAQVSNPMLQATAVKPNNNLDNQQSDRLMEIERNVQSNIAGMRDQIGQLSNQVNNLTNTNQALINQISDLTAKMLTSQQALEELLAAKKSQPVIHRMRPHLAKIQPKTQKIIYYVQAVIPGRAWLINSEGATLTVRVGSRVPGFGVVHRIDELQGRVTLSSGHVISFAQAD